ncbi:Crp/Fnr family transcriptional regulator [uncultured Methylobacterium sp.]|uniref:Crp/Fnr family transcriptional regulator n=1 Tax=uncultured Methylobacterium sp. TaxID=157278 RepID=UPI0035C98F09
MAILAERDHSIGTLAASCIAEIPRETIIDLTARRPNLARAFWWATLVDESILREWLASMGQRVADKRVAHLFCELLVRLQAVGCATENGYDLPMTQIDLADLFGFTPVHANRMMQELRGQNLIILKRGHLDIPDVPRLKVFCGFRPNYLHLNPRRPDA